MLVGEGLAVGGVKGDVLGRAFKRSAEAEQLAVGSPAGALLGFFAEVAEVGNGFLAEHLGVFAGVDQGIHQALEPLGADDVEVAREFFPCADPPAKEVAEGQFDGPAIGEAAEELLAVFLAVA